MDEVSWVHGLAVRARGVWWGGHLPTYAGAARGVTQRRFARVSKKMGLEELLGSPEIGCTIVVVNLYALGLEDPSRFMDSQRA